MILTRRHFLSGTCATGLTLLVHPAEADGIKTLSGPAFGSTWTAVVPSNSDGALVTNSVTDVVADVDAKMSPYRAESPLSRFNRSRMTDWRPLDADVTHLAEIALDMHRATGGAFDPTVGPLVHRYGFGPIAGRYVGPDALELAPGQIRKLDPFATLDLCGIAKGHALDRIVATLTMAGISNTLVELGGEIRTLGTHPSGREWIIGVERPMPQMRGVEFRISPRGLAVATSGHASQGYSGSVGAVSHLIDPHRQQPAEQTLASVTVLANSAVRADAAATALAVAGQDVGPKIAARLGWTALFQIRSEGGLQHRMTGGFANHLLG